MKKEILLITLNFHGIEKILEQTLQGMGYHVTMVTVPILSRLQKFSIHQYRLQIKDKKIEKETIKTIGGKHFDYLLALGVFFGSDEIISQLKTVNPQIKTVLALWDSFSGWDFSFTLNWFDRKYSFDPVDCENYKEQNLIYNPDFFIDNTPVVKEQLMYDLCHIGTLHQFTNKRLDILLQIKQQANMLGLKTYITLFYDQKKKKIRTKISHIVKWLFNKNYRNFEQKIKKIKNSDYNIITDVHLTLEQCFYIEKRSKCIVDVATDVQSGYPIRTINTIASGQKLITSSKYIVNEPFFNKNNIFVIDYESPVIDLEFLNKETRPVNIEYLSLKNWLKRLVEE